MTISHIQDLKEGKGYKVVFKPAYMFKILEEFEDYLLIRVISDKGNYTSKVAKSGFNDFIKKGLMKKASDDELMIEAL